MAQGKFSKPRPPRPEEPEIKTPVPAAAPQPEARPRNTSPIPKPDAQDTQPLPEIPEAQLPPDENFMEEEEVLPEDPEAEKKKKIIMISLCCAAVLLLVGIIVGVTKLLKGGSDDGRILNNVIVAGVDVGGMTPEQAKEALHRATDLTYSTEDMVITLPDDVIRLSPDKTGAKLDVDAAVEAAYNYGRTGSNAENQEALSQSAVSTHVIAVLPYLDLDLGYISQTLQEYGEEYNSDFTPASYKFDGTKPALDAENFDETVPCQTLILNTGTPGRYLDIEELYKDVLDAYSLHTFQVTAEVTDSNELPEAVDLEAIFAEYCSDPVDAVMDMDTFEVTGETYGYTFDLEKAQKLLAEAEEGAVIGIPMEYVYPEVLSADLEGMLFRDVLGSYETKHTSDTNRNTNLKLACEAINGYVLNPGETFSYNDALGKRTAEAGYKEAGAYSNGETVSELGGGICQVSSTLYYAALLADVDIVTRTAHSYVSSYIPMGMDATVSWGGPEFKFKNSTDYPIRIEAEVSDGYVRVKILGTDERDYYVKMDYEILETRQPEVVYETYKFDNEEGYKDGDVIQTAVTGYVVKTYKYKYDKETNELLSKEDEATSIYMSRNKIIASVLPEETLPPETTEAIEVTEEPTAEPSETVSDPTTETTEPLS